MTSAQLRRVATWTTGMLVALIVVLTLFISPAEGDSLSRMFPGTIPLIGPFIGDETGYDTCVGGISCQDGHAIAFIALGASLAVQVLAARRGWRALTAAICVLLALMAFAAFDELAQGWTGRDASREDWLADVSGAALGLVLGSQLTRLLVQEQPER